MILQPETRDRRARLTRAFSIIGGGIFAALWPLPAYSNELTSAEQEWTSGGRTLSPLAGVISARTVALTTDSFEDATVRAEVDCARSCDFGVLLNATPTGDGWTGLYTHVSPSGIQLGTANVSAAGIVSEFKPIERQGSGFGRTLEQNDAGPPRPGARATSAAPPPFPTVLPRPGRNTLEVIVDGDVFSAVLNGRRLPVLLAPVAEGRAYGPAAFIALGDGLTVNFAEVRDGLVQRFDAPRTETPFVEQRLTTQYIAEAITYGDFNKDGVLDISAGPSWYEGPDFKAVHEVYLAPPLGPMEVSSSYHAAAFDFSGDGYDDILQDGPPGMPATLYVNPGKESRRWAKHQAFTGLSTETLVAGDLDGDGKPELVFGQGRRLVAANPDPANIGNPWIIRPLSTEGWTMSSHGAGIGDIDGDGRSDVLVSNGWWQQPLEGVGGNWTFHAVPFGNVAAGDSAGATAQMYAYDVDGDGRNDVVSALEAHGWGLGWFRQVRDSSGGISFEKHEIMGDDWPPNTAPVFSQLHALAKGDIDQDGLSDIVTGKRWWAHRDGPRDPDGRGAAVVYWFKLIRDQDGARFEPRLINNDSGVGVSLTVADLNQDGRPEVLTANRKGVFVFRNRP